MRRLLLLTMLCATTAFAGNVSVKDFGTTGDGVTLDTRAVQSAVDRVAGEGGGVVSVPAGTYLCGSIWLRSNVELHLEAGAVIKGSPDIDDYCAADCCPQNEAEIGFGDYMSGGHLLLGVGEGHIHDAVFSDISIADTGTAFNVVASYSQGSRGTDIDGIIGIAPNDSHIWARKAAPFRNIVLKNVNVPPRFECVDAFVRIKGGLFRKRELPPAGLKLRRDNIENEKKLLY